MPQNSKQQQFFSQYMPMARQIEKETGVPAMLILSQAALESNYGKSAPGFNFFGIKGDGQQLMTTEVINGQSVRVPANFRSYGSAIDSFRDHARLISTSPNYAKVMEAARTGDPIKVAQAIGDSPYATDPNYGQKILSIIKQNNLADVPETSAVLPKGGGTAPQTAVAQLPNQGERPTFTRPPQPTQDMVRPEFNRPPTPDQMGQGRQLFSQPKMPQQSYSDIVQKTFRTAPAGGMDPGVQKTPPAVRMGMPQQMPRPTFQPRVQPPSYTPPTPRPAASGGGIGSIANSLSGLKVPTPRRFSVRV